MHLLNFKVRVNMTAVATFSALLHTGQPTSILSSDTATRTFEAASICTTGCRVQRKWWHTERRVLFVTPDGPVTITSTVVTDSWCSCCLPEQLSSHTGAGSAYWRDANYCIPPSMYISNEQSKFGQNSKSSTCDSSIFISTGKCLPLEWLRNSGSMA